MVRTHTGDFAHDVPESSNACAGAAATRPRGPAPELPPLPPSPPPPPPLMSLEQLLATQNELMRVLTENLVHYGVRQPHHQPVTDSYTDFLAMHPLTFIEATDSLEADNWLRIIEFKFGLLHHIEF
jgi:hypothetical protein